MNKISQRDSFWNKVYQLARNDRNIVIVTADMGAPALDKFRIDLPSQYVNVGIAEPSAITIAAGLALTGKRVFAYAIAPFITLRCLEQIRVQSGLMKIPITIVGVGAGLSYEESGPTHHLIEDIAIMRSMPHITINNITDSIMASAFAEISCRMKTTNYVRLDRQVLPDIYDNKADFTKGLAVLKDADDYCLVSTGNMTHIALEIQRNIQKKVKAKIGLVDIFTLPINEELFLKIVKGKKKIITLEEHFLPGGFGSAVCEVLNDHRVSIPVKRIGLPIEKGYCYQYGGREVIRNYYGIGMKKIEKTIENFIS